MKIRNHGFDGRLGSIRTGSFTTWGRLFAYMLTFWGCISAYSDPSAIPEIIAFHLEDVEADVSYGTSSIRGTVQIDMNGANFTQGQLLLIDGSGNIAHSFGLQESSIAQEFRFFSTLRAFSASGTFQVQIVVVYGIWPNNQTIRFGGPGNPPLPEGSPTQFSIINRTAVDLEDPDLLGLTVSQLEVTAESEPTIIIFDVLASDDVARISYGSISLQSPSGNTRLSVQLPDRPEDGSPILGTYRVVAVIPAYSEPGDWEISLTLEDRSWKISSWMSADLLALGLPSHITVTNGIGVDDLPPSVVSIAFEPESVSFDEEVPNIESVTMILVLEDNLRGVSEGRGSLRSPGNRQSLYFDFDESNRVAGDALDGTYQIELQIPPGAENGDWTVALDLKEDKGGVWDWDVALPFGTPLLSIENSPESFEGPVLDEFNLSQESIDTTSGDVTLTMTMRITSEASGFLLGFIFIYNEFFEDIGTIVSEENRISGDMFDGIYVVEVIFPKQSREGLWDIEIYLLDRITNARDYPWDHGLDPSSVTVIGSTNPLPPGAAGDGFENWMIRNTNPGLPAILQLPTATIPGNPASNLLLYAMGVELGQNDDRFSEKILRREVPAASAAPHHFYIQFARRTVSPHAQINLIGSNDLVDWFQIQASDITQVQTS